MKSIVAATLVSSALSFANMSCGDTGDDLDAPELALPELGEKTDEQPASPKGSPLDRRRAYLAAWGTCLHRVGGRLEQSWQRYAQDVNPQSGKIKVKDRKGRPYVDPLDSQLRGCPLGDTAPPTTPPAIATKGRAFVLAARGYGNRAQELGEYFKTRAYEEDRGAKLVTWAPDVLKAYEDAHKAAQTFREELERARTEVDTEWLARIEQTEGKSTRWHVGTTTLAARDTSACAQLARPLPERCTQALATFSQAHAALEAHRDENRAAVVGIFWFDVFRQRSTALAEAGKALHAPLSRRKKTAQTQMLQAATKFASARAAVQAAHDRITFDFP